MSTLKNGNPWDFLDEYKNTHFSGEWPTLPEMFNITVERFPKNKCFTTFDPNYVSFTYEEALDRIQKTAAVLVEHGVKPGDRVAVTGKNSPEWAIAYMGILYAGGVVVPLDYQLHKKEVENLMEFSDAKVLFIDEEKYDSVETGGIEQISLSPQKPNYILELQPSKQAAGGFSSCSEDDLAAIMYTSGTTGKPKGVMLTHKNLVSDCYLAQGELSISNEDVFYALLPIHHSYTMLAVFIEGMSVGAEIVFAKRLVIKQILADFKQGQVTMFLGVPMLFNKLIKGIMQGIRKKGILVYGLMRFLMGVSGLIKKLFHVNIGKKLFGKVLEQVSLEHNRICISGGGPLPSSTFRRFNQLGIDFVQGYGLTETSPIVALNPVEHYKEDSVGRMIAGTDTAIDSPDERGRGEILLKGPMIMQGYYKNEEATKEAFTKDGFFKTGDMGYLDKENYLYLTGRKKSMIVKAGGKNVYPEEIEDHFQLYEEVEQILVRGYIVDEKERSEDIEALVYPNLEYFKANGAPTEDEWKEIKKRINTVVAEVNKELLPYQRIQRVEVLREPMEMTTTKKIKRHKVET